MDSREYWENRERNQLKHNIVEEAEYQKRIEGIYDYMMDQIQKEINGFYTKYADKEGITLSEAKRRVSKLDIEEYGRKAAKYVKDKDFSDEANEEMRLYNATMKINRLEMLKANIGLELVDGFNDLQKYFEQILTKRTLDEFERQAGILGATIQDNEKAAHTIVNASFHNAKFSERIWMYQDMMKAELAKLLQIGLIQGKHPRVLARHLAKLFGVRKTDAERLMQTELARVQTEAQRQSFERNGYDQYEFIALETACKECRKINGNHFKVEDMMPGKNAPPMHPRCRCSTAAYMDRGEFEKWLEEREKSGNVPGWLKDDRNNGKINLGSLGDSIDQKHLEEMKKRLVAAPKSVQNAWNQCVDKFKILSTNFRGTANYDPVGKGININVDDLARDRYFDLGRGRELYEKSYGTLFHELGHNMSSLASQSKGRFAWEDYADIFESKKYMKSVNSEDDSKETGYTLTEMLKKEGTEYIKESWNQMKEDAVKNGGKRSDVKKGEAYAKIRREIRDLPLISGRDVSDMWEGITDGSVSGYVGHKGSNRSYWKHITVGTEGFAEMTDATINNPESLEQIKKYFPKSYEIYLEMLEDIGKGV